MTQQDATSDRTPRAANSRGKNTRRTPWKPPSTLEAPPAPPGFKHRWIREAVLGQDDRSNMSKRLREGFEVVRAEEYPDFEAPTVQDGMHKGVIGVGGLVLARIPEETVEERNAYFRNQTEQQMLAVDSDLMRESNPAMPLSNPQRQTKVAFGTGSKPES